MQYVVKPMSKDYDNANYGNINSFYHTKLILN